MTAAISTSFSCPPNAHRRTGHAVDTDVQVRTDITGGYGAAGDIFAHTTFTHWRHDRRGRRAYTASPRSTNCSAGEGQPSLLDGGGFGLFAPATLPYSFAHHVDHDRHEAVSFATQLGTLPTNTPSSLARVQVSLMKPGMVALHRQLRHPPGVNHVVAGDQEANLGVHWDHQRLVNFQQVELALGLGVVYFALRGP